MNLKQFWTVCKIFALIIPVGIFGCSFLPEGLAPLVAGPGGRAQLLQKSIETLHKSVQWSSPSMAQEIVAAEIFPMYLPAMIGGDPKNIRVVDLSLSDVRMDQPVVGKAYSISDIRIFASPSYSVKTISKRENWEYSRLNGGWILVGIEEPAADKP